MFDPTDSGERTALHEAIQFHFMALRPHRERFREFTASWTGANYGRRAGMVMPVNQMALMTWIFAELLVPNRPRAQITTKTPGKKAFAYDRQLALDVVLESIDFEATMRECVMAAITLCGFAKVALETQLLEMPDGDDQEVGMPFVEPIALDDWIQDMNARRWSKCRLMGNRYLYPLKVAQVEPSFDPDVRERLVVVNDPNITATGEWRTEWLSRERYGHAGWADFEAMCELEDLYLPFDDVLITKPVGSPDILKVADWRRKRGQRHRPCPFHRLGFMDVPQQTMPFSPMAEHYDAHLLIALAFHKLGQQAERAKTITVVPDGADRDAENVKTARDGQIVRVSRPEAVREMRYGGPDPGLMAFAIQMLQQFSRDAGNLDAMGGLAAMSDTLGQDQLISGAANKKAKWMGARVDAFTQGIMRDVMYHLESDPFTEIPITKRSQNGMEINRLWGPDQRAEDEDGDYDLKVDPYSQQILTPQQRGASLAQFWNEIIMPNAQALAMGGAVPDVQAFVKLMARYRDQPELQEVLRMTDGTGPLSMALAGGEATPAPRGRPTSRTYERVSRRSPESAHADQVQSLLKSAQRAPGNRSGGDQG